MSRSAKGRVENPGVNVKAKSLGPEEGRHFRFRAGKGSTAAMINYKAEGAGRRVIAVDPAYTEPALLCLRPRRKREPS